MTKRVLILSWEYPPRIVGGLARVVQAHAIELAALGCDVHVVTADSPECPEHRVEDGVHVHCVKTQTDCSPDWPDFRTWISRLNFGMLQYAIKLHTDTAFDIVHAHDWLAADAAWVMKSAFGLPLISNIHATEYGRSKGLHTTNQRYIHQIEWRLIFESREVIVNSTQMVEDLKVQLNVPETKITVIPNGIYPDRLLTGADRCDLRRKHNLGEGPVILFVGRLVEEKGVQVLLRAAPHLLASHPDATIIIVGAGYFEMVLKMQAAGLNLGDRVRFFGQANDNDLQELYGIADVQVVPSLYEPFGIVVLEGMAAGVPVVTSDRGGINDIVEHLSNGVKTIADDEGSLCWGIQQVLQNRELAERLKRQARQDVLDRFSWSAIARRVLDAYDRVIAAPPFVGDGDTPPPTVAA